MKKIIIYTLVLLPFVAIAQSKKSKKAATAKTEVKKHSGVDFIHKVNNWDDVVKKASDENKFIFVDCYTTWCGPCKYVSAKVFPLQNVGDFYNKNFVNVKLQIDETEKDNEDVKATRAVAKMVEEKFKINAYPTFLIFDKKGNLVHKFVGAGDDKMFIEKGKQSIDANHQYYTLLEKYQQGDKDAEFLKNLLKASADAGENADEILTKFIKSRPELYTKENADIIIENTEKTEGIGFITLYQNKEKWAEITDKTNLYRTLKYAIEDEVSNLVAEYRRETPDWDKINRIIDNKYPEFADEILLKTQIMNCMVRENWEMFEEKLTIVIEKYPNMFSNIGEYNALAWGIFGNIENKELLAQALDWSKKSIELAPEETTFLDTYANLLYKTGNKDEAIKFETKAMNMAKDAKEKQSFADVIAKMKKGEKTWK